MRNQILLFLYLFILLFADQTISAQSAIDTTRHCIYTETHFSEMPYFFRGDETIENLIDEICESADVEKDFEVRNASISTIAAVIDDDERYLLYNRSYARKLLKDNPTLLQAMLAHEIGHLARGHKLNDEFRLREELQAAEFTGRALYQLKNAGSLERALNAVQQEDYAYRPLLKNRPLESAIKDGWAAADGMLRSKENLGYFENEDILESLPIPVFKLKGCPRTHQFDRDYFRHCKKLKEVDKILSDGIKELGYEQLSYNYLPNGYAMMTAVEQIRKDGTPLEGTERWQDYPAGGRFEGILDYLSALVLPRPGYFRMFVFMVTDQTIQRDPGHMDGKIARAWLKDGGYELPTSIGNEDFGDRHKITVLLYEFEASEATHMMEQRCNALITLSQHLTKSGVNGVFRP